MKTRYFIFGAALCSVMGLSLTSCNNDEFLTVDKYDSIDPSGLFEKNSNAIKGLNGVYDMLYPNDDFDGDWGFKPNLFTGCHPTIDTQATGWDKNWNSQGCWEVGSTFMQESVVPTTIWVALMLLRPTVNLRRNIRHN